MSRCLAVLFALTVGACHWVFGHDGPGASDLGGDCGTCEYTPAGGALCTGKGVTLHSGQPDVVKVTLDGRDGRCSRLELEVELEDPALPGTSAWLLNVGDSDSNNGFGGDTSSSWNDSELEVVSRATWTLDLWGNDYYSGGKGSLSLGAIEDFIPTAGRSRLKISIWHGHARVERQAAGGLQVKDYAGVSTSEPLAPCAIFCINQWEKFLGTNGDGDLFVAFGRTIKDRGASSRAAGISRATLTVR